MHYSIGLTIERTLDFHLDIAATIVIDSLKCCGMFNFNTALASERMPPFLHSSCRIVKEKHFIKATER